MSDEHDLYGQPEHVSRAAIVEIIDRKNELERVVGIFRQALADIAGEHVSDPHRRAHQALRDADHEGSRRN